jgi:K+-transporting ATPase ATPase C chain
MKEILTSIRLILLSIIVCCVLYPAALLAFGQLVIPWRANGSLLTNDKGTVIGSALIAQSFTQPQYFWSRPSAVNYDASAAGGSNLSPTNPQLTQRAQSIVAEYDLKTTQQIPADLVTASGSGLDPHITLEAALFQLPRVAAARHLDPAQVKTLIQQSSQVPTLRVFGGKPVVNVLQLNIALDSLAKTKG